MSMLKNTACAALVTLSCGLPDGAALAESGVSQCISASQAQWKTTADIEAAAKGLGFEGTCYEVKVLDKDSRRVEVYFHPVSTEIVRNEVK